VSEHGIKPRDLGGQIGLLAKAQENDAGVGLLKAKHELTKVAVIGDKDTLLGMSQGEHRPVCQPCWIIAGDPGRVMATLSERVEEARIRTLIQQEPHS
jgi:hypothetical protein